MLRGVLRHVYSEQPAGGLISDQLVEFELDMDMVVQLHEGVCPF
jgi:hypothetical protein